MIVPGNQGGDLRGFGEFDIGALIGGILGGMNKQPAAVPYPPPQVQSGLSTGTGIAIAGGAIGIALLGFLFLKN